MKQIFEVLHMKTLPLSVIVPVYNVAPYLARCLDSVLAQTRSIAELICVDDGSTDESGAILDAYAKAYATVRVIHQANGGQNSARKAGLRLVTTPYVTCIDADDWIEPCMYEELMDAMLRTNADVVTSGYFQDFPQRQEILVDPIAPGMYEGEQLAELRQRIVSTDTLGDYDFALSIWDKVYRTELLRAFQMRADDHIFIGEDQAVVWPLVLHADRVYETGRAYYHYVRRPDSVMGTTYGAGEKARLDLLMAYLREQLLPLQPSVPNIALQCCAFELFTFYMWGAWQCCQEAYGNVLRPFGNIPKDARIALYGAGKFGVLLKSYLDAHGYDVVLWVDQSQSRAGVERPSRLLQGAYDIVLIAVLRERVVRSIRRSLTAFGVPEKKVRQIDMQRVMGRKTI